jgi:hypothetical protein
MNFDAAANRRANVLDKIKLRCVLNPRSASTHGSIVLSVNTQNPEVAGESHDRVSV